MATQIEKAAEEKLRVAAEAFMKAHLGGNMNTSTLTPFAIQEIMAEFSKSQNDLEGIIQDVKNLRVDYPGVLTVREAAANEVVDKVLKIIQSWLDASN